MQSLLFKKSRTIKYSSCKRNLSWFKGSQVKAPVEVLTDDQLLSSLPLSPDYEIPTAAAMDTLSNFEKPVRYISDFIHESFGVSWALTIFTVSLTVRFLLMPIAWKQLKLTQEAKNAQPERNRLMLEFQEAYQQGITNRTLEAMKKLREFDQQHSPGTTALLSMACQSLAYLMTYRGFASLVYGQNVPRDISTGGLAWFTDLSQCDPNFVLPFASSLFTGLNMYLARRAGLDSEALMSEGKMGKYARVFQKTIMYGSPIGVFLFTSNCPCVIAIYFLANNFSTLIIGTLNRHFYAAKKNRDTQLTQKSNSKKKPFKSLGEQISHDMENHIKYGMNLKD